VPLNAQNPEQEGTMKTIHAIYENGVFRPTETVHLPEGARVRLVAEPLAEPEETPVQLEARRQVFEILSRSYDAGEPGDILETHDDHQP
jgi:predicted DNA-binding antitoxin AbrB/MazE fold protein